MYAASTKYTVCMNIDTIHTTTGQLRFTSRQPDPKVTLQMHSLCMWVCRQIHSWRDQSQSCNLCGGGWSLGILGWLLRRLRHMTNSQILNCELVLLCRAASVPLKYKMNQLIHPLEYNLCTILCLWNNNSNNCNFHYSLLVSEVTVSCSRPHSCLPSLKQSSGTL